MNNEQRTFNKSPLAIGIAALLCGAAAPAQAVSWNSGDWSISFDSTFSLGTSIRVEDRDMSLIGNSNQPNLDWSGYNPATNIIYSSADVWGLTNGAYSANNDNGNLNFDSGEAFSTLFKGVHELNIRHDNIGFFARGMYFYDFELMEGDRAWVNPVSAQLNGNTPNDPCRDDLAKEELCADVRLLDAFLYADFFVGDVPVTVRVGDQVVSWGESTFITHGINSINPVDVSRALAPGAELKEVFIPVGTAYTTMSLTENFGFEAYYQYEWEHSRLPQSGSYFATNDFAGAGGQGQNIQLGFTGNPDIDLDFLLANLNSLGDALRAGADPAAISQAYLANPTKVAIRAYGEDAHIAASDSGQYGVKLSYYSPELNETEFGLYHINYHSKRPLISGVTSDFTAAGISADIAYLAQNQIDKHNIVDLGAFTRADFGYPEDIKLYGFSFNTNVGETALAGEIAYRQDEPIQIDDVELLYAAMPQQLALAGLRPDLAGISQFDSYFGRTIGPGGSAKGYLELDTVQAQMTATHIFGPVLGTDNLIMLGEVGYVSISDMPSHDQLRMSGPGTNRSGVIPGKEGLQVGLSNGPETAPFPTDTAWGYRILAKADFNNVYSGINLFARATFAHDVDGITPDPMFLFVEDRKSASLTLTLDYLSQWSADFSYNAYWGGEAGTNGLKDRDFISFNVKYSI